MLGPGIVLDSLEMGSNSEVTLRVRYRLGELASMTEGRGETIVAAHADPRQRPVGDGHGLGMRALVG